MTGYLKQSSLVTSPYRYKYIYIKGSIYVAVFVVFYTHISCFQQRKVGEPFLLVFNFVLMEQYLNFGKKYED